MSPLWQDVNVSHARHVDAARLLALLHLCCLCVCVKLGCSRQAVAWECMQRSLRCQVITQVQRMEQRVEHGTVGTKQPGTVGMGGHRVVAEE